MPGLLKAPFMMLTYTYTVGDDELLVPIEKFKPTNSCPSITV